jgi:hypothetical protein
MNFDTFVSATPAGVQAQGDGHSAPKQPSGTAKQQAPATEGDFNARDIEERLNREDQLRDLKALVYTGKVSKKFATSFSSYLPTTS